jgi:hypothetical protein
MGKIENFQIHLNTADGIYRPADKICGYVLLTLSEELRVRVVTVEVVGRAKVKWSETTSTGQTVITTVYKSKEPYIHESMDLIGGSTESNEITTLAPQEHHFPFAFELKADHMPSSFEGKFGSVRYLVRARLDLPMRLNRKCERFFTVIADRDLNQIPGVEAEIETTESKTLRNLVFVKTGTLRCTAKLPFGGFVPGQALDLETTVEYSGSESEKNDPVQSVSAKIVQRAEFIGQVKCFGKSRTKRRHENTVVAEAKTTAEKVFDSEKSEKQSGGVIHSTFDSLVFPSLPPNHEGSQSINVGYLVKIEVDPAGLHRDLTMEIPITLGTVPLTSITDNGKTPSGPMAPPSYEECIFGSGTADAETDSEPETEPKNSRVDEPESTSQQPDQQKFCPKYPVYRGFSSGGIHVGTAAEMDH